ncbi:uncharacterized protein LOC124885879 [Capsicum annuum]|uniref:uncharacterized protein LOC124885879 n=1 Tax=Capsicum annuum TaxID=4072 RepID=UPI001FB0DB17|nr:uncharacterized protein LOC124885879 [Capsicum annuum]
MDEIQDPNVLDPNAPVDPNVENVPTPIILGIPVQPAARPIREVAIPLMNHVTNSIQKPEPGEKEVKEKEANDEICVEKKTLPLPFPQRERKRQEKASYKKLLDLLKKVQVMNLAVVETNRVSFDPLNRPIGPSPKLIIRCTGKRSYNSSKKEKKAISWQMSNITGINPTFCMHNIYMEEGHRPKVQQQQRLNHVMKEVVRKEVIKWLVSSIVYPIFDIKWVSPVHYVPKKKGMIVVTNDNNELIPTCTVTGWRICIDYRMLNEVTHKDHYPISFIDQMLDKLTGQEYYYFLDGYSSYNQIITTSKDQKNTSFMCPYSIYAFRRMPFGLCNAPAIF